VSIIEYIRELNLASMAGRVLLALVIGGILGLERESKRQPAGFRTYMLVCLGAALVMMTNQYICGLFGSGDPSRLGAQVISGIGFLGAGTIIVTGNSQVRGLTTAAGLWSSACIGLAIGIGFYEGAILVGIAIILIMTVFQKIDYLLMGKTRTFSLYVNFTSAEALNYFIAYCKDRNIDVIDLQVVKLKEQELNGVAATLTIKSMKRRSHTELLKEFGCLEGLKFVEGISL
jgi:putative Mg2+ transporter-C (MgtC) family protein